jgi:hypothetical protein
MKFSAACTLALVASASAFSPATPSTSVSLDRIVARHAAAISREGEQTFFRRACLSHVDVIP